MEGVPRIRMINFPLKEIYDPVDFEALKKYISEHYDESPNDYEQEFIELQNLRKTACAPSHDITGLNAMKRYFSQLQLLRGRFPMEEGEACDIAFSWEDVYQKMPVVSADIRFEEMSTLFNIGALHSRLGARESRGDSESMKVACTHFQCAAWAFQRIVELAGAHVAWTPDCEPSLLRFKSTLMLSQAQECILEKSILDHRKTAITAKVAQQLVDFNVQCLQHLGMETVISVLSSRRHKEWKRMCDMKRHYYQAIAYLSMGESADECQRYGERLTWFNASVASLEDAQKAAKDLKDEGVNETIRFATDVICGRQANAKKENDFIYSERVPELQSLPEIRGASLVKGLGFEVSDKEISGPDIFRKLVPISTHAASSVYSEEKAKLLRKLTEEAEEKNTWMDDFLSSMSIATAHPVDIPISQDLLDCCAQLRARTEGSMTAGEADEASQAALLTAEATNALRQLVDVSVEVEAAIADLETMLAEEKEAQETFSASFPKSGPPPGDSELAAVRDEAEELKMTEAEARSANMAIRAALERELKNVQRLMKSPALMIAELPSVKQVTDMNLIHVWSYTKRAILNHGHPPETLQDLRHAMVECWEQLPQSFLQRVICGMPRRVSSLSVLVEATREDEASRKVLLEVARLLTVTEDMRSQRTKLIDQLRQDLLADDITQLLISGSGTAAAAGLETSDVDRSELYAQQLKKHDKVVEYLRQNMTAQGNVAKKLEEVYFQYAPIKKRLEEIENSRREEMDDLCKTFNSYTTALEKTSEGVNFYERTSKSLSRLAARLNRVVGARRKMRETVMATVVKPKPQPQPVKTEAKSPPQEEAISAADIPDIPPVQSNDGIPRLKDYLSAMKARKSKSGTDQPVSAPFTVPHQGEFPTGYAQGQPSYSSVRTSTPGTSTTGSNVPSSATQNVPQNVPVDPNTQVFLPWFQNQQRWCYINQPGQAPVQYSIASQRPINSQTFSSTAESKGGTSVSYSAGISPSAIAQHLSEQQNPYHHQQRYQQPQQQPQQPRYQQPPQPQQPRYQQPPQPQQPGYQQPQQPQQPGYQQPQQPQQPGYQQPQQPQQPGYQQSQQPQPQGYQQSQQPQPKGYQRPQQPQQQGYQQPQQPQQPGYQQPQQPGYQQPQQHGYRQPQQYPTPPYSGYQQQIHSSQAQQVKSTSSAQEQKPQGYTYTQQTQPIAQQQYHQPAQAAPFVSQQPNPSLQPQGYLNSQQTQPAHQQGYRQVQPGQFFQQPPVMQARPPTSQLGSQQMQPGQMAYPQVHASSSTQQPAQHPSQPYAMSTAQNTSSASPQQAPFSKAYQSVATPYPHASPQSQTYQHFPQSRQEGFVGPKSQEQMLPQQPTGQQHQPGTSKGYTVPANFAQVAPQQYSTPTSYQSNYPAVQQPNQADQAGKHPASDAARLPRDANQSAMYYGDAAVSWMPPGNVNGPPMLNGKPVTTLERKDLLSSSPIMPEPSSGLSPDPAAVLTPKVLTREELEEQHAEETQLRQLAAARDALKKDPLDDNLTLNTFIAEVERFFRRIADLERYDTGELHNAWKKICDEARAFPKKSMAIGRMYPMKNRFPENVPFDESRVVLKDAKDDYINASHIDIATLECLRESACCPKFIVAQAPLLTTLSDFWTMVLEQGCEVVAMLACPAVNDVPQSVRLPPHWPQSKGEVKRFGSLEVLLQAQKDKEYWTERVLTVRRGNGQTRTVVHLQYHNLIGTGGVRGGIPASPETFCSFVNEVRALYKQQRSPIKPIMVLCGSGSGVSGTLVALYAGIVHIENTGRLPASLPSILLHLWKQKSGLVEDEEQFLLLHRALAQHANELLVKRNIVVSSGRKGPGRQTSIPSPQTFLSGRTPISELQTSVSQLSESSRSAGISVSAASAVIDSEPTTGHPEQMKEAEVVKQKPSTEPLLNELAATLTDLDISPAPPQRRRITKRDFLEPRQTGGGNSSLFSSSAKTEDPSDPFSSLDPMWSMKK